MKQKKMFKHNNIFLLFIDLKNAYDKVNHSKLFQKMQIANINPEIIGIVKLLSESIFFAIDN